MSASQSGRYGPPKAVEIFEGAVGWYGLLKAVKIFEGAVGWHEKQLLSTFNGMRKF